LFKQLQSDPFEVE